MRAQEAPSSRVNKMAAGVLFVVATAVMLYGGSIRVDAAQCTPDPTNPCKARCNGTLLDISTLFDYP